MSKGPDYVAMALATWRVSRMLYDYERGPAGILDKIRRMAGVGVPGKEEGELATLITCPYCIGLWVGLVFSIMYVVLPERLYRLLILPFAWSAVTVLMYENADPPHPT